ncbi:taste receptor type 2 member 9-like [Emydura macquarii macquarii]|uniref:taste receptor type 2 member 9-like n=1 Tax=Emydura macquarii macquarii TaxID=1129001 RepID=UPI00352A97B7
MDETGEKCFPDCLPAKCGCNCVIILVTEAVVGIWMNVFIVAMNCIEWIKKRCLTTSDKMVASKSFPRLIISTILLLFSLWRHIGKMQNSSNGFRNPNMNVHVWAVGS